MVEINDISTRSEYKYYEYIIIKGSEPRILEDKQALWLALVGEIKTKPGEVQGVGLTTYGCDIYKILGQPINNLVVKDVEYYIEQLIPRYPQIKDIQVDTFLEYSDGKIEIILLVDSIFGKIKESVIIGGPC
jgi:hypothetical protein